MVKTQQHQQWIDMYKPTSSSQLVNVAQKEIRKWLQDFYQILLLKNDFFKIVQLMRRRGIYPLVQGASDILKVFGDNVITIKLIKENESKLVTYWEKRKEKWLLDQELTLVHDYLKMLQQLSDNIGQSNESPWQQKRGLFIYGQSGIGKTLTVELIAKELGYHVLFFDKHTKKEIKEKISECLSNGNILEMTGGFRPFVIIMDELDSILHKNAFTELIKLINPAKTVKKPCKRVKEFKDILWRIPIICITNVCDGKKMSEIKQECLCLHFDNPSVDQMVHIAKNILNKHHIQCKKTNLEKLANMSKGDLRYFIQGLQAITNNGQIKKLDENFGKILAGFETKNRDLTMYEAINSFFTTNDEITHYTYDMGLAIIYALHENFLKLYTTEQREDDLETIGAMLDAVSTGDIWEKIVHTEQAYSLCDDINIYTVDAFDHYLRDRKCDTIDVSYPKIYKYSNNMIKQRNNIIALKEQMMLLGTHDLNSLMTWDDFVGFYEFLKSNAGSTDFVKMYPIGHKYRTCVYEPVDDRVKPKKKKKKKSDVYVMPETVMTTVTMMNLEEIDHKLGIQTAKNIERLAKIKKKDSISDLPINVLKRTLQTANTEYQKTRTQVKPVSKKPLIEYDFFAGCE